MDRGLVRGTTDLPESTLLRILLLGRDNIKTNYYAARVSGGWFRMTIDADIEADILDARATVAPLSQQPEAIKRWAERKFDLGKKVKQYLPRGAVSLLAQGEDSLEGSGLKAGSDSEARTSADLLRDPGDDLARGEAIKQALEEWISTVRPRLR